MYRGFAYMDVLGIVGIITITLLVVLLLSNKISTMNALIALPILACIIIGQSGKLSEYVISGLKTVAPTGTMFIFAVLFFGIMGDAGTFDRIVNQVLKIVGTDPLKICIGTLVITCIAHLDGSGAVTYLITIPAMLPIFKKLKMDKRILATICALGEGTVNMVPWGGPTLRASMSLNVSLQELYNQMIIPQIAGIVACFAITVWFGLRERKRLNIDYKGNAVIEQTKLTDEEIALQRPHLFIFNVILILATIICLTVAVLPPAGCFMVATVIAFFVNYPDLDLQRKLVDRHAQAAMLMASTLFAAGIFTGIMKDSGMLSSIANGIVTFLPTSIARHLPVALAVVSMPLTLVFDPDSFYYGILPVFAEAGQAFGIDPLMIGRAAMCGHTTLGCPISPLIPSTFLLIGLSEIGLPEHQKHSFIPLWIVSMVILVTAIVSGIITI